MDLTIHHAILDTSLQPIHIGIHAGRIALISPDEIAPGEQSIEARGNMLSPAFSEPHFHLENSLLGEIPNHSGTLQEAIKIYAGIKKNLDTPDILARSTRTLKEALANGVLWMRNNVDIDHVAKLRLLEGVVAVTEKFKGVVDIYNIAFPQLGLARNPEAVELMWQAMESGAVIVGGMPHGERDMDDAARHIEIAFEIAKKFDADIDMHVDETDNPYWHSLELLADKTIAENYQGRVTAGHVCAMGSWDDRMAERIVGKVVKANLNITTNVPVNLLLEGRADSHPFRRGIPRVRDLLEAGVNVACGQDDMWNMFYPFGRMDPLEVANFVAHSAHLSSPALIQAAFDMPRYHAARTLRLPEYGIQTGYPANLVLIEAVSAVDALRRQPTRTHVIREGKVLVTSHNQRTYAGPVPL